MSSKINWLVSHTSPSSIVLLPWLLEHGIGYSLAQKYAKSGWLKRLASGVYYRPDARNDALPTWVEALHALNSQLQLPVHLAGLSSLTHQGLSHYLPVSKEQVWLGVEQKSDLPKWFREFDSSSWSYCTNTKLELMAEKDLKTITVQGQEIKASCPELAAYEVVDAIGKLISFEHAAELFQGLVNLSPRKVQSLLERSDAIQANRIFLFLSHYHGHQWVKRLDESKIKLGSGKRQVVEGGRYDERYKITVPMTLDISKKEQDYG